MKHQIRYVGYRVVSGVFSLLPEWAVRWIGDIGGRIWHRASPRRRLLIARHMRRIVGAQPTEAEVSAMVKRAFRSYGRYWAEVFWIRPRRKDEVVAHSIVEGSDGFKSAVASGRGVILALPHMGNWEIAGANAEDLGGPVLAAAEALSNPKIIEWFVEARAGMGIEVVVAGRGNRATAALSRRLKQGGVIALLADRDISGSGIEVAFFGERTTVPPGPAALAQRSGAVVLPVGSYFREGRGHHFAIGEPIEFDQSLAGDEAVSVGAQLIATELERIIRVQPWDWHLFVPNWPSDRREAP